MPGAGKTTLVQELVNRDVSAFDADDLPGIWRSVDGPHAAGVDLDGQRYAWNIPVMQTFLAEREGSDLVVAGVAQNFFEAVPLFSRAAYLNVSERTMRHRLASTDRTNPLGSTQEQVEALCRLRPAFYEIVGNLALQPIDAELDVGKIADVIIPLSS